MTMPDTAASAAQHAAGYTALAKRDFERANAAFDQAIVAVGDGYVDTESLDDTGMQLTLAQAQAKQGDYAAIAKLKAQVVKGQSAQAAWK